MAALALDERGVLVTCPSCGQRNRLLYGRLGDAVRCGSCKKELTAPAAPLDIPSSADFDRLVTHASIPVVVDYWAPWCGPCRMVAPELAKVAARNAGRLLVVKVNTDALSDLSQRFGIRSIPTLAVFAGGREAARTTGARPAGDIEKFVEDATSGVQVHGDHKGHPGPEGRNA
jgi:thioredoxin 2